VSEITLRIRQVKPGLWQDEAIARLKPEYRLVYVGLWCVADDAGWVPWKPREIAYHLGLSERLVQAACDAIRQLPGRPRLVVAPCGQHAQVPNLPEHQRFSKSTHRVVRHEQEHLRECEEAPSIPPPPPLEPPSDSPPVEGGVVEFKGGGVVHRTNLYNAYSDLTGDPCDNKAIHWIDDLVRQAGDRSRVGELMYAWPKGSGKNLLGWVTHQLRSGDGKQLQT
jgi:hypothetical protein